MRTSRLDTWSDSLADGFAPGETASKNRIFDRQTWPSVTDQRSWLSWMNFRYWASMSAIGTFSAKPTFQTRPTGGLDPCGTIGSTTVFGAGPPCFDEECSP